MSRKFGILRTGLPERIRRIALAEFTFRVPAHRMAFCKSDLGGLLQGLERKTVYLFMAFRLGHLFTGNRLSPPSGLSAIQVGINPPANKPINATEGLRGPALSETWNCPSARYRQSVR